MRNLAPCVALMLVALLSQANGDELDTEQRARWSHCASVRLETTPSRGVVELALTPEVFDLAREDLADLRVVAQTDEEVPYVLRVAAGKMERLPVQVKLYNRTYIPGKQSSVIADFGSKTLKNRIQVETPGSNFRRRVTVEGSDDGQNWQMVREDAFLFRIGGEAARGYEKKLVALPDNDQRHLRVTVYNAPDDPAHVEIENVRAWRLIREPAETVPVAMVGIGTVENEKERRTEIGLDLGYRNLPLYELGLRFGDANFFRRVSLLGRNRTERIIRTPVEAGPPREETVPEPWSHITRGAIYRYSSGGRADESLVLNTQGARCRYLQVLIRNDDNPPLRFDGTSVSRLRHYLAFQPKGTGNYALYFGNPSAEWPHYDIVHYIDRLRREGVVVASLAEARPNPTYGAEELAVPWSERYRVIIWLALLAVLAVLGRLVYRQVKTASSGPP